MTSTLSTAVLSGEAPSWEADSDVVVVGSGAAGLTCALTAAEAGLSVLVVTKGEIGDSNTSYAQGGVAVVRSGHPADHDHGDSVQEHVLDTLVAGSGLCDERAVRQILRAGPSAITRLIARGARFDAGPGGLLRTREGGHGADRVIHAGGDATGAEIQRALQATRGLPAVLTGHLTVDVALSRNGMAAGIYVLDPDGRCGLIRAGAVVLATGGVGQLFAASTNPAVATADGLAMALRAGAVTADLEFIQFHPTALWTGPDAHGHRPLVTEAIRGAGATLVDGAGRPVMAGVHPLGDLAPRDVVSLAITRRLAENPGGIGDHVFLDCSSLTDFADRFPTVTAACRQIGIDPAVDPLPVSPAAHYHCGGVWTDGHGRTTVAGLYAAGEVARTGLHGANRLASNSLLEGLVMGERVAAAIAAARPAWTQAVVREHLPADGRVFGSRSELQTAMSRHVGIGRDEDGLRQIALLAAERADGRLDRAAVEATNLAQVSAAVVAAATRRTESRGCHIRTEFGHRSQALAHSLFVRIQDGVVVVGAGSPDRPAGGLLRPARHQSALARAGR